MGFHPPLALRRQVKSERLIYRSAIAQTLAPAHHETAIAWAAQFVKFYQGLQRLHPSQIWPFTVTDPEWRTSYHGLFLPCRMFSELEIRTTAQAFIEIELPPAALSAWLQAWSQGDAPVSGEFLFQSLTQWPSPSAQIPLAQSADLFLLQSTHARCVTLLHQGASLGWLRSMQKDHKRTVWEWPSDRPLYSQPHKQQHPPVAYQALLYELLYSIETWAYSSQQRSLQRAMALCKAFSAFDRTVTLWDRNQSENLRQQQLGLVLVTQRILCPLLEQGLGLEAPWEL